MLITEHSIPNTRNTLSSRMVAQQPNPSSRTIPHPTSQAKTATSNVAKLMSKAGDRQSWLLLALVLLPIIGMVRNFMTYGFER
jgi:hypothetical protein